MNINPVKQHQPDFVKIVEARLTNRISVAGEIFKEIAPGQYQSDQGTILKGTCVEGKPLNGDVELTFANKKVYKGPLLEGEASGLGKLQVINGICTGVFQHGKLHGYGTSVSSNGAKFEGNWVEGNQDGHGMYTFNGTQFEGHWDKGNFIEGVMTRPNGNIIEGNWSQGQPFGKMTVTNPTGDKYEGELEIVDGNFIWHGRGKLTLNNGNVYTGTFVHGALHGRGVTKVNGEVYEGEFVHGKEHGRGKFTLINGDVYVGGFILGYPEGTGKANLSNGDVYVGGYVQGKPEGKGVFSLANDTEYVGNFTAGKPSGSVTYTTADGYVYEGTFTDASSAIFRGLNNAFPEKLELGKDLLPRGQKRKLENEDLSPNKSAKM